MLFSLALIVLCGFVLGGIMQKIKLPAIVGMLLTGIILGPYVLNLLAPDLLNITADLKEIALIIILTRAGLSLDIKDLKKVGRPAILMCFVPATFEIAAAIAFGPLFFDMSYLEAAMVGAILGAVSPAVIVPRMLKLMEEGYGTKHSIPQIILTGASADDIYTIVLFAAMLGMYGGGKFNALTLLKIPVSIIFGLAIGVLAGIVLVFIFKKLKTRDTVKILLILGVSFLLVTLESAVEKYVPISGLLGVMALGATVFKLDNIVAERLANKFSKIWIAAEIILFAIVGASVDVSYAAHAGISVIGFILILLVFRILGVFVCFIKTPITLKERVYCAISCVPKATVQAALGGLPLAAGVMAGNIILTISVMSILITAPLGAIAMDLTYKKLLKREGKINQESDIKQNNDMNKPAAEHS